MLKYVKDFFKTLSMELGGIRVSSADLSLNVVDSKGDIRMDFPQVDGISTCVDVLGENVQTSSRIVSADFKPTNLEVIDLGFHEGTTRVFEAAERLNVQVFGEKLLNGTELLRKGCEILKVALDESDLKLSLTVRNGIDVPVIWNVSYRKSMSVKKDMILEALSRLLRRYGGNPEEMEFLGYFRKIPLGMAEAVIVEKGRLVLRISRKAKKPITVDLVAVKTPKGVMVEVIR